ncbi:MAG: HEAT repeat domain-containing protein [Phycisphaerae bacterium]|nr:HEAT repeat domain-containing protein [Phycisphaerae bacterium]
MMRGTQLILCGLSALVILAGILAAENRPTTAPGTTTKPSAKPTTRPSDAKIAEARATLARAIAPPAKLTSATTKRIKELIGKLGNTVWKVREAASAELLKSGPEILPLLNEVAGHKDIEVSDRVGVAIKAIQARVEDVGTELNPAINILASISDKKLIDILMQLLDHASDSGRYTAEYALRRLTGENFGFNTRDEPASRVRAAAKWRKWWKDSRAKFSYDHARIKARSVAMLVSNDGSRTVSALTLQGKMAWSKKMRTTLYCVTGTGTGSIIVGYSSGTKNVEEYNLQGKSVWAPTGVPNGTGGVFDISRLPNGNTLITYTHRGHVTEVNAKGKVVWQKTALRSPISAQRLENGNTLIAEHSGARVIEVDRKGAIVWQKTGLKSPCDAIKLPNGNVLIGEYAGKRVLEVDRKGKILWQRLCPAAVSGVCRLPDGTTAITNKTEGVIVLGRNGKKIRQLLAHNGAWGKIRLVPAAVLTYK